MWLTEVVVMVEDDDDWTGAEDDNETASSELCFIFFFSLSLALVFFLDQFLFREGEREGLICGEA